mgnify:CR=1 FL=1
MLTRGGGTSAATPLWAALVVRLAALCGQRLGDLGPALYALAPGTGFRDVTREVLEGYQPGAGLGVVTADLNGHGWTDLYVANDLMPLGYEITLFEALKVPGGLMRSNIPAFRLPAPVLNEEIDRIVNMGVDLRLNSPVSSMRELLEQGYEVDGLDLYANWGGGEFTWTAASCASPPCRRRWRTPKGSIPRWRRRWRRSARWQVQRRRRRRRRPGGPGR